MVSFLRSAAARSATPAIFAMLVMAVGLISARPAHAGTISIPLTSISAVGLVGTDQVPTVEDDVNLMPKLSRLQPASWAEFPFTVPAGEGAVYTFTGKYGTPNPIAGDLGLPVAITVDFRQAGSDVHFGSQDLVLTPTGTDDTAYQPTASFSVPGISLPAGDYVLRVRNVSMIHTTISNRAPGYLWRNEIGANATRRVDLGTFDLNSTGSLPATGTISGKVTSSDMGYGVGGAWVMAVPTGQEVGEPGPWWTAGRWTVTDATGNYSLSVPSGTAFTVQAGRPDSYNVAGARVTDVTVGAGATVTKDLAIASRWTSVDGTGQLTEELEYFFAKVPDAMDTNWTNINLACDGNASNQFKLGWTGPGDFVDVYVDVPTGQSGDYDLTCVYCSYPGGTVQFTAHPDTPDASAVTADLPNSSNDPANPSNGYWMSASLKYADPIHLHEGRNVVRAMIIANGIDFDAIKLEKHIADVVVPGQANPKDANFVWAIGEKEPGGQVAFPEKAGNSITNLYRGNYVEIPMTFDSAGIYTAAIPTKAWGPVPKVQLDLRPAASTAHYATDDITVPAVSTAFSTTTVADIPVLQSGDYILRVRNTTQFHSTPDTRGDFNAYGSSGFIPNRLDFGQIVFTKTGALPAVGTISGTVKSTDIGVTGVLSAEVMANPVGSSVPEPSIHWQKGFWTMSGDAGAYSIPVLAGTYEVQAGQAAEYAYSGGLSIGTVSGGGTATVNVNLPSRVTQDATGHYELNIETEYFTAKPTDSFGSGYAASIIAIQENGLAHNRLLLGYTDGGDWIDIPVDVPAGAAGEYTLTDYYFNGYWDGHSRPDGIVSFTANLGSGSDSTIQDTQPNTAPAGSDPSAGYNTPGIKVFGTNITLLAGHNVIRMKLESGSSNFDAFKLTSVNAHAVRASAARVLRIVGGLDSGPATGAEFTALDASKNGKIDLIDAVMLVQLGFR